MTLSPLMIKIVLHYFTLPTDFQNGDFSPCGVAEAITCFMLVRLTHTTTKPILDVEARHELPKV